MLDVIFRLGYLCEKGKQGNAIDRLRKLLDGCEELGRGEDELTKHVRETLLEAQENRDQA